MQHTPVLLPGKFHGQWNLAGSCPWGSGPGYSPWGHTNVRHNWATEHAYLLLPKLLGKIYWSLFNSADHCWLVFGYTECISCWIYCIDQEGLLSWDLKFSEWVRIFECNHRYYKAPWKSRHKSTHNWECCWTVSILGKGNPRKRLWADNWRMAKSSGKKHWIMISANDWSIRYSQFYFILDFFIKVCVNS